MTELQTPGASAPTLTDPQTLIPVVTADIGGLSQHACDARTLHGFLGVQRDFSNWLRERIDRYGFQENQDFGIFAKSGENSGRGRPTKDYLLTLDMAKELAMVENNDRGREARRYFIAMERQALAAAQRAPDPELPDPPADPLTAVQYMLETEATPAALCWLLSVLGLPIRRRPDRPCWSVRDLVVIASKAPDLPAPRDALPVHEAERLLAGAGLKVEPPFLLVPNRHPALARILRGTWWEHGWRGTLRKVAMSAPHPGQLTIGGYKSRATAVPLGAILDARKPSLYRDAARTAPPVRELAPQRAVLPVQEQERTATLQAAQHELLRVHKRWDTLRRCVIAGLNDTQTAAALAVSVTTIGREKARMRACGLLEDLPLLPALVQSAADEEVL